MVPRDGEQQERAPVDQGQDRSLPAGHELLHDHLGAGRAEDPFLHEIGNGAQGFFLVGADTHALPGRQAVGLDDYRVFPVLFNFLPGEVGGVKDGKRSGGNGVPAHELLGELLRGLQHRSLLRRAENFNAFRRQEVAYPPGQRGFGPDHHQLYLLRQAAGVYFFEVVYRYGMAFGQAFHRGGAGDRVEFAELRALSYLPGQGVFPAAGTYEEYVHRPALAEASFGRP